VHQQQQQQKSLGSSQWNIWAIHIRTNCLLQCVGFSPETQALFSAIHIHTSCLLQLPSFSPRTQALVSKVLEDSSCNSNNIISSCNRVISWYGTSRGTLTNIIWLQFCVGFLANHEGGLMSGVNPADIGAYMSWVSSYKLIIWAGGFKSGVNPIVLGACMSWASS
jgi:hypothetical protein